MPKSLRTPEQLLRTTAIAVAAALVVDLVTALSCGALVRAAAGLAPGIAVLVAWSLLVLPRQLRKSSEPVAAHRGLARSLALITALVVAAWYAGTMITIGEPPTTAVVIAAVLTGAVLGGAATVLLDEWLAVRRLLRET